VVTRTTAWTWLSPNLGPFCHVSRGHQDINVSFAHIASGKVRVVDSDLNSAPRCWDLLNDCLRVHPAHSAQKQNLLSEDTVLLTRQQIKVLNVHGTALGPVAHQLSFQQLLIQPLICCLEFLRHLRHISRVGREVKPLVGSLHDCAKRVGRLLDLQNVLSPGVAEILD